MPKATLDYRFANHGSICTLTPLNTKAETFLSERVGEDAQWWAGGLVIEPRYVEDIVRDLTENEFTVGR